MLRPQATVPAAIVQGTLAGLAGRRPAAAAWLTRAGLPPVGPGEGVRALEPARYAALYRLLVARLDDEAVGLLSRRLGRGSFALILRSTLGAPTVDAALRRAARTFHLLQDDVRLVRLREGGRAGLAFVLRGPAGGRAPNFLHELLLRVTWLVAAWLHGGRLPPAGFDFAFAEPAYAPDYARIFPGPLRFGRERTAVWLDRSALRAPARRDAVALRAFLAAAPANVVAGRLEEPTAAARVRALLQRARPAWPGLAGTARRLGISASTLQRRLAAEGASFRAVRDALRRDLAIARLQAGPGSLAALSEELGFGDSASFQRAFKAWTGRPAGSYRPGAQPPPGRRLTACGR